MSRHSADTNKRQSGQPCSNTVEEQTAYNIQGLFHQRESQRDHNQQRRDYKERGSFSNQTHQLFNNRYVHTAFQSGPHPVSSLSSSQTERERGRDDVRQTQAGEEKSEGRERTMILWGVSASLNIQTTTSKIKENIVHPPSNSSDIV